MPESRKRPGHQYQKPSDIPAKQRTKGRIIWSILFAVFGFGIAFFSSSQENYTAWIVGAFLGALLGYMVGKNMEQDAKKG